MKGWQRLDTGLVECKLVLAANGIRPCTNRSIKLGQAQLIQLRQLSPLPVYPERIGARIIK